MKCHPLYRNRWSSKLCGKALEAIKLNIIYALMIPVIYANVNETLTSMGNSKFSTNDGVDYYYL